MTNANSQAQVRLPRLCRFMVPALLTSCALTSGCATDANFNPLPTYTALSDRDSLSLVAARQTLIKTVSARCDIVLTDPQGQTVNLDGALLAIPVTPTGPNVRLRAWKLGQAVFDITLTSGQAWLIAPDNPRVPNPNESPNPAQTSRRIAAALDFIGPAFFESATITSSTPIVITATSAPTNLPETLCVIDRATLTPQRFTTGFTSSTPTATSEIIFSDYRLVSGIPWAHHLHLTSPGGTVSISMSDVELNVELPPSAFVPPARARQLP